MKIRVLVVTVCVAGSCAPYRGDPPSAFLPLGVGLPLAPAAVAGCYFATDTVGAPFFTQGGYWSAPVRLGTTRASSEFTRSFARSNGIAPLYTGRTYARGADRDTPLLSTIWYVRPPDSLVVLRVGAFSGEQMLLRLDPGRDAFVGEWNSSTDVVMRDPPPALPVRLRRVRCPGE